MPACGGRKLAKRSKLLPTGSAILRAACQAGDRAGAALSRRRECQALDASADDGQQLATGCRTCGHRPHAAGCRSTWGAPRALGCLTLVQHGFKGGFAQPRSATAEDYCTARKPPARRGGIMPSKALQPATPTRATLSRYSPSLFQWQAKRPPPAATLRQQGVQHDGAVRSSQRR